MTQYLLKNHFTYRCLIIAAVLLALSGVASAMNIDATNKYVWGENIGWINFGTTEGDVDVTATAMDGYAWGENVGWFSLTCDNTSSCGTVDYGVTISGSDVAGYAWGENIGWVSFSCDNTSSCGTVDYGVTIDTVTGIFSGYAWGENVGWLVFNCDTTSSCGVVDYKLQTGATLETATPQPAAEGPSGVYLSPSPTVTPAVSVTPSPSVTATPVVTPPGGPTPTAPPPGATPSTSPSGYPREEPGIPVVIEIVDRIAEAFDALISALFSLFGIGDGLWCAGPLGVAACGATALPLAVLVLLVLVAFAQSEWIAALFSLLQIFGIRRRARVWGVVYDTRTKRPIPLVKLELLDATNRVLETRYADRDGRYGFLLSPASLHEQELHVQVRATKPGYVFPSGITTTGTDYIVYDNLYRGGPIVMKGSALIHYNIPMDPGAGARPTWNGFGSGLVGTFGEKLLSLGFYIGIVVVPLNWWLAPTTKNLIILIVFFGVNAIRIFVAHRPYGITADAFTGKRMPFALVVLNDALGNRQGFAVSDEHGRYILSGKQGIDYEVVAYTPANVSPQRSIRVRVRGVRRMTTRAWITNSLKI